MQGQIIIGVGSGGKISNAISLHLGRKTGTAPRLITLEWTLSLVKRIYVLLEVIWLHENKRISERERERERREPERGEIQWGGNLNTVVKIANIKDKCHVYMYIHV